jgi:hypothetical protein
MERLTLKTDEERRTFCISKGIDPSQHCCLDMAWFISDPVEWESQGRNPVIAWIRPWNEYRIEVSHQSNSATLIYFCPWCGRRLPASLREEWYQTLYGMGYNDPGEQDIPDEFESDTWWRKHNENPQST